MTDPAFKTFSNVFSCSGLIARYAPDRMPQSRYHADRTPGQSYSNMENLEPRQENALSSRLGRLPVTVNDIGKVNLALGASVHTLGRLKGLGGATFRYAGSGANLKRRTGDTNGAYSDVNTGMSGSRFTQLEYRPDFSSYPYAFFADVNRMLKDNGSLSAAQLWGIFPPTHVPSAFVGAPSKVSIEDFNATTGMVFSGYTGTAIENRVNTTFSVAIALGRRVVTPVSMANIVVGGVVACGAGATLETVIVLETTATTFTAVFTFLHLVGEGIVSTDLSGSVAASTTATISKPGAINLGTIDGRSSESDDVISLMVYVSDPSVVSEIRLIFDVGDGTFNTDYYWKAIATTTYQNAVDGVIDSSTGVSRRVLARAAGQVDFRKVAQELDHDLLNTDDFVQFGLRPAVLNTGKGVWTRIEVRMSEFVAVGRAGDPGKAWANVNAWRLQIKTNATGSATVKFDDMYLYGGSGPDVFAGVAYDYRVTYYNINTGYESLGSQTWIGASYVSPRRQPVTINWTASTDPQITHVRIYRRGGTISSAWYKVADVAIGTTTYVDTMRDSVAVLQKTLEIDNEPPVTSTLQSPVDTTLGGGVSAGFVACTTGTTVNLFANQFATVGSGDTEEVVIIDTVTAGVGFTAYFQYAHSTGERVQAVARQGRPLNLGAIAFDRAWLAGDPDNPHLLYYSKIQRPESFPGDNFLEIGNPSDPIMAVVSTRGQLYVFTLSTVYQVVSVGSGTPSYFKTGAAHGLVSNFAWCESEGEIFYRSYDGIYVFTGGRSQYLTEQIEWLFKNQHLGPVVPIDQSQLSSEQMAFKDKEVFFSYTNTDGERKRLVFSTTYNRWRNDNVHCTSMLFEKDTFELLLGMDSGMIFRDRHGDYDNDGYAGGVIITTPIVFTLQGEVLDFELPKTDKVFNEFTLDANTNSQNVAVSLLFDDASSTLSLGNVSTATRDRSNLNIGGGAGRRSQNVALKITASATQVVDLYIAHIRALVEAEYRKSFDSYWLRFDTDEYKLMKQGWFEYVAPASGGVVFSVYIDGDMSTPVFSFTLPQATNRTGKRVRFPAVKAKAFRFVATSAQDFNYYEDTHLEIKSTGGPKGYSKVKVAA